MTESRPPVEERFKCNVKQFFEMFKELVEVLKKYDLSSPVNENILGLASFGLSLLTPEQTITNFIDKTNKEWHLIKERKHTVFVDYIDSNLKDIPMIESYITGLHNLFDILFSDTALISDPEKNKKLRCEIDDISDHLWNVLDACVRQSITFIHEKRVPSINGETITYSKNFFPSIKVKALMSEWSVKV